MKSLGICLLMLWGTIVTGRAEAGAYTLVVGWGDSHREGVILYENGGVHPIWAVALFQQDSIYRRRAVSREAFRLIRDGLRGIYVKHKRREWRAFCERRLNTVETIASREPSMRSLCLDGLKSDELAGWYRLLQTL